MNQKLNRTTTSAGSFAAALLLLTLDAQLSTLFAQGTAFSYQGRLTDNGNPANGNYDLRFSSLDAATAGNQVGSTSTLLAVAVSNGLFTITLDFGAEVFTGPARWLELATRTNGSGSFTTLSPRQPLLPVPYAIYAAAAATTTNVGAGVVVKSLNGLTDAVTLSPGANVTLATNGNALTISSTGGGAVFSLNGTNAFYNAGFVGIGTSNPALALTMQTPLGKDAISWGTLNHELGRLGTATSAGDIGWLGLWDSVARNVNISANGVSYLNGGNVGIGTTTPSKALTVRAATGQHAIQWENSGFTLGYLGENGDVNSGLVALVNNGTVTVALQANGPTWFTGGDVGIGTTTPQAKLDVRGDIRLGPSGLFSATSGEENLRIVRGEVNADGSAPLGCCFTAVHALTGVYDINFSTAFAGPAVITVTPYFYPTKTIAATIVQTGGQNHAISFRVTIDDKDFNPVDWGFDFIAIGPR